MNALSSLDATMRRRFLRCFVVLTFCAAAGEALATDDPCSGFRWDVSREQRLFGTAAETVTAGKHVASAPLLIPDRLYDLAVTLQQEVTFAVAPGKKTPIAGASAGLARMHLPAAGEYRISLDQGFWIDVVAENRLLPAEDFQGRPGCRTPHKIVVYWLPGEKDLILQLSGAAGSHLRLTITPVPAGPAR